MPDTQIAPDAFGRRARTHDRLEAEGTFYPPGLMLLPGEAEVRLPAADAIVLRALALVLVGCEATGLTETTVDSLIDLYRPSFSAAEWRWFESPARDPDETRNFGWGFEAALPLLWSTGLAEELKRPDAQTEPFAILQRLVHYRRDELLARAALRSAGEILDAADLNFCRECASRLALNEGQPPPAGLDGGVLLERHRAFTWLIEGGRAWDDVVARA
ncbi:MAG TPA: DUF4272 domain-containing protein [Allosphingosinicella sp.]